MQTEIIRIIESALSGESRKTTEYSKLLIKRLRKEGDVKFADRIERTLKINGVNSSTMSTLDEISSQAPRDGESKMSMLEIENPKVVSNLILDEDISDSISQFILRVKNRKKLKDVGLDPKLSLLLYGPPGCGKTTIANYIAKEANLPIVTARLDTIVSSLLGSTSKNIRKVFDFTNNKPCILFIDEFDAIAKARDNEYEHGELKRVINSLLQSIDQYQNVLIAATNHSQMLDSAVWRRFSTVIEVKKPTSPEFIEHLLDSVIQEFNFSLESEKKNKDMIIQNFQDLSPSEIRTILISAISNAVIKGENKVQSIAILAEIYRAKNHNKVDKKELIEYLNQNFISQVSLSEWTGLSLRKIKEITSKKESNG
jgi:SpoVK/Ycf46/Vps4 family AAA+-type ATPase